MKINTESRWRRKYNRMLYKEAWHSWFAWYPIKIDFDWYWLEVIERKYSRFAPYSNLYLWDYRPKKTKRSKRKLV